MDKIKALVSMVLSFESCRSFLINLINSNAREEFSTHLLFVMINSAIPKVARETVIKTYTEYEANNLFLVPCGKVHFSGLILV